MLRSPGVPAPQPLRVDRRRPFPPPPRVKYRNVIFRNSKPIFSSFTPFVHFFNKPMLCANTAVMTSLHRWPGAPQSFVEKRVAPNRSEDRLNEYGRARRDARSTERAHPVHVRHRRSKRTEHNRPPRSSNARDERFRLLQGTLVTQDRDSDRQADDSSKVG